MTIQQLNPQTADVQIPNDERLHRLAVEAAKFNGLSVNDSLECKEIIEQGKANGYKRREVRHLLASEGYNSDDEMRVPAQRDVLGELWKVNDSGAPKPSTQYLKSFRKWCEDKREMRKREYDDWEDADWEPDDGIFQHPLEHSYSYKGELQKFVRAKDVERWFIEEYCTFTTVLITYIRPRSEDESVAEHAQGFYPRRIKRKRRECIKATGHWDEYAGVSLLAPKANPTAQSTHAHDALVIPSFVSSECFAPLESIDGVDVSIRYHRSDKVEAPPAVNQSDLEQERGATTALAQEVGANLPVFTAVESLREAEASVNSARMEAALDATDCPDYVERWCAHMSAGEDGDPSTNGVQRWRPLGRFKECADSMKDERDYGAMGLGAKDSDEEGDSPDANLWMDGKLSTSEAEFVRAYLDAGAPIDRETIEINIDKNIDEIGGMADTDLLVDAIFQEAELSTTEKEFVRAYLDAGAPIDREIIETNIEENINELGGEARIDVLEAAIRRAAEA